jgi:uncharacterized cupredoxin-like copper-binding protein
MRTTIAIAFTVILSVACQERETTVTTTGPATEVAGTDTAMAPAPTDTAATDTSQTSVSSASTVAVRLVEYRIEMPATLPAGPTTFAVRNDGKRKHNIEIEGQGLEAKLPSDLDPGQRGELTVDLKPGQYEVYCPVRDHKAKHGMTTTLTVR